MQNLRVIIVLLICVCQIKTFTQQNHIYKHPLLDFQFTASENWSKVNHPEDNLIYELKSPDNRLHVMLWYTETEQSAKKYLIKMADMKGLADKYLEPTKTALDDKESWLHETNSIIRNENIKSFLSVTAHGYCKERPKENCLFIVQVWCNNTDYFKYKDTIDDIFTSVKIDSI
jgi:hypothetical protein